MLHPERDTEKATELNSEAPHTIEYDIPEDQSELMQSVTEAVKRPFVATVGKFLLIGLLISAVIIFVTGFIRYSELSDEKDALKAQISSKEEDIEEKEYLLDIPLTDKDYIVRVAKEKLGLFLPGEIVYYSDLND